MKAEFFDIVKCCLNSVPDLKGIATPQRPSTTFADFRGLNSVPDLKGIAEDRLPLVRLPLTAGKEEVCGRRIVDDGQRPARV